MIIEQEYISKQEARHRYNLKELQLDQIIADYNLPIRRENDREYMLLIQLEVALGKLS